MAKIGSDEIDHFDLYSCFPAIVQIARDALGLRPDDPRPLTVTGGLPYFGGAGNNYTMHAIATMVERLRDAPGSMGLVTANGWYITKHSLGIYSTARPEETFACPDSAILQQKIDAFEHPLLSTNPAGPGTVETYTVLFGRDGNPETGLVIGRLKDGGRFIAHTESEASVLTAMLDEDPIGKPGIVTPNGNTNRFVFAA
jgi:acetyl-CoA C-acetyltransferase